MFRSNGSYDKNDALHVIVDSGDGWRDRYSVRGYHRRGVMIRMAKKGCSEGVLKLIPYKKVAAYVEPWR